MPFENQHFVSPTTLRWIGPQACARRFVRYLLRCWSERPAELMWQTGISNATWRAKCRSIFQLKRCADDETLARAQLRTEWTQFSSAAKTQCLQEVSIDGAPSYVEFLTCLEMERDVTIERQANKTSK